MPAPRGGFFMRGRIGGMPDTLRNELARILADLDRCLANAERIAAAPADEDHDSALDFLIEFQEVRQRVEAKLRGE
jgi:hypothetical protein